MGVRDHFASEAYLTIPLHVNGHKIKIPILTYKKLQEIHFQRGTGVPRFTHNKGYEDK